MSMRRTGTAGLLAALALLGGCADGATPTAATPAALPSEAIAVDAVFTVYRGALVSRRGQDALGVVTAGSVALHGQLRDLALEATPDEVRALPGARQLLVLTLRLDLEEAALAAMTDAETLEHLVNQGRAGQEVALGNLGEVTIAAEDQALGVVTAADGTPTPLRWRFLREQGGWRFDLADALTLVSNAVATAAAREGRTTADLVAATLGELTGAPLPAALYEPRR